MNEVRMNRLTLSFKENPYIETDFLNEYCQKSLRSIRSAFVLGVFLYAAFGVLDPLIVPEAKNTIWIIRYAVVCPFFVASNLFTFTQAFKKTMQPALSVFVLVPGLGIILMVSIAGPPGSHLQVSA